MGGGRGALAPSAPTPRSTMCGCGSGMWVCMCGVVWCGFLCVYVNKFEEYQMILNTCLKGRTDS